MSRTRLRGRVLKEFLGADMPLSSWNSLVIQCLAMPSTHVAIIKKNKLLNF